MEFPSSLPLLFSVKDSFQSFGLSHHSCGQMAVGGTGLFPPLIFSSHTEGSSQPASQERLGKYRTSYLRCCEDAVDERKNDIVSPAVLVSNMTPASETLEFEDYSQSSFCAPQIHESRTSRELIHYYCRCKACTSLLERGSTVDDIETRVNFKVVFLRQSTDSYCT